MQAKLDLNHGFSRKSGFLREYIFAGNLDGGDLQV